VSDDKSVYLLKNLHANEFEEADLFHSISEEHIDKVENSWKPILQTHLADLKSKHKYGTTRYNSQKLFDEAASLMIQDAHWNWQKKYQKLSSTFGYSSCALLCDNMIQGLGYFDISEHHKSRIITDKPTGVVYIEFIASAPWNRKKIAHQKYAGVGEALVTHAIKVSIDEGLDGRIGLHSLPQAEIFYRNKCKMKDFGIDTDKKMRYFEMSLEQVTEWLSKIQ